MTFQFKQTTTLDELAAFVKIHAGNVLSIETTLAQLILETGWRPGQKPSVLATEYNNLFGIKKSDGWTGKSIELDTKEDDGKGNMYTIKGEFRWYDKPEDSVKDHSTFIISTPWRKDYYRKAIEAKTPQEEAHALTGTYATDTKYGEKLIGVMNTYNLWKYGTKATENKESVIVSNFPKPPMVDRRKSALGYPGHGAYAKRNKSAIQYIVWHYTATTHAGDGATIIRNHEDWWKRGNGWDIGGYAFYIDRQGKIFWNYDLEIVTYGAGAINPKAMHISCEASSASNYTPAQIKSREVLTLWLLTNDLKHLNGNSVKGHNYFMNTTCPGYSIDKMKEYSADLNKKLKAGGGSTGAAKPTPTPTANDVVWPAYKKPTQAFDALKVGDKVTIRKGLSAWFIPNTPKVGRKPSKDFAGDTDTITKVMDVNVGYSKKAYLLKDKVSWILEQDLENARKSWSDSSAKVKTHTVKSGEYLYLIGEKYGVTVANIKDWNGLSSNVIFSGQKLVVEDPSKASVTPVQPALPDKPIIEAPIKEQPKDDGNNTPAVELKDGEFMWEGIKYKIVKEVV